MSGLVDKALDLLVGRAMRRGRRGDPVWLAVGAAAWMVRRSRRREPVVWQGSLKPGDRLLISSRDAAPGAPAGPDAG